MPKPIQIAFIGNERHLLYALRAMTRYGVYAKNHSVQYTFLLFGTFPQEILKGQMFQFQCIGKDRVDMESFAKNYDTVLDPERDFVPGGLVSLAQWFEMKLNMEVSKKSAPLFLSDTLFHIRSSSFRLNGNQLPVGNTVFFMPPSPQDRDWDGLPESCASWWSEALHIIDLMQYSIVYPQVCFHGSESNDSQFDYRFFFTGFENDFCSGCYMPKCETLNDLAYHLCNAKMYVGWDSLISDLAASLHIPSILVHNRARNAEREVFTVRNDEYLLRHIYFSNPMQWHHDKLREELSFIEERFTPLFRPVRERNRVRDL